MNNEQSLSQKKGLCIFAEPLFCLLYAFNIWRKCMGIEPT